MVDNTIALQVRPPQPQAGLDLATPLMTVARLREADTTARMNEMRLNQEAMGQEARGLLPYVGQPEFGQRWGEAVDRLAQQGHIDPQRAAQIRNTPSPLILQQLIAQTSTPEQYLRMRQLQQSEAAGAAGANLIRDIGGGGQPSPAVSPSPGSPSPLPANALGPMPAADDPTMEVSPRQVRDANAPAPQAASFSDRFSAAYNAPSSPPAPTPASASNVAPAASSAAPGGLSPQAVRIMAQIADPHTPEATRAALTALLNRIAPADHPTWGVTGEDQFGNKTYGFIDTARRTVSSPVNAPSSTASQPGLNNINNNLSGEEYLKQFPAEIQAAVRNYLAGNSTPTGNPRRGFTQTVKMVAQKYGADIGVPADDATFAQRRNYRNQLASANPSSVGGQRNALNTALGHAADAAEYIEALNNKDPVGMPLAARATNAARAQLSTEQAGRVRRVDEAIDRLAGEVGKLYSGSSGGGVHEREATRNRFNANMSNQELAGALEATAHMMSSRLYALEAQRDEILGPGARDVQMLTEKGRAAVQKINTIIGRLRGQQSAPPAQTTEQPGGRTSTGVTYTIEP